MEKSATKRLSSLDALRGITIAGMILVNNAGDWGSVYAPLRHVGWDGLTPTDLVFPFFMFIMGISTYISLKKYDFRFGREVLFKILKRTAVIFMIGLAIAWLGLSFRTFHRLGGEEIGLGERLWQSTTNFSNLRILGVLQRLAITYCITSLIAVLVKHKYIPYIIAGTLVGYFILMLLGNGTVTSEDNIIAIVDRAVLGTGHMLSPGFDPEGLLSTISATCNVLIGFLCGKIIAGNDDNAKRITGLFVVGAALTFAGFLFSYGCPINKKIWSSTFVLVTCGMGATLLAMLTWIIDVKGRKRWSRFFESFGTNPLFIYVFAEVLSVVLSGIVFTCGERAFSIKGFIYGSILQPLLGNYPGSLAYSMIFVLVAWLAGYILYRKNIHIKI